MRPPRDVMVAFIDAHRGADGVEPISAVLPIAPSTYYAQKVRQADPGRLPARAQRDAQLRPEIERVWQAHRRVYGAKKVWKQLNREALPVARCTVARLMGALEPLGYLPPAEYEEQFHRSQTAQAAVPGLT